MEASFNLEFKRMNFDINAYSLDELREIRKQIDEKIRESLVSEVNATLAKLNSLAKESGTSVSELVKSSKPKTVNPAKYRNPDNANETWSGKGKSPNWFKDHLEKGATKESMLINPE
jgi:DNA-binding protein H-NS